MVEPLTSFSKPYTTFSGNDWTFIQLASLYMKLCCVCDSLHGSITQIFCIFECISVLFRAVEQRPDLSCLWKLLGDACTTVSMVSPNRVQILVPALLAGADPKSQSRMLNQAETIKVGER